MSSAVLIQQASGDARMMLELSADRHAAYCDKHRLTYWPVLGDVQFSRAPHWNKIALVRHALALGFETVVWLDADTLIVRDDEDIRSALNGGGPLALARHPTPGINGTPTHWNSGVMVMRNTARTREFFDAVWQAGPHGEHHWHEQARMLLLLPKFPDLVQQLDDRWNSTDCLTDVPNPVIKAWHGAGRGAIVHIFEELLKLGAADSRIRSLGASFVNSENCGERSVRCIENIPPYPKTFRGRGIVIGGGGLQHFPGAWVCIHQLRRLGCTLPIQLWYLGDEEMDERMRRLIAPLNVACVDARHVARRHPARILRGWELKPFALLHSSYREVLLLDADNVPIVNPEFLFDTPQFRETGAVFWPDQDRMSPARFAWKAFGVRYRDEPEIDGGQILLDKEKSWRPLWLTMWFNEYSDYFYRHVWGDKDTFRFAWHRLEQKFSMPNFPLQKLEDTFCQHDFDGRRVFQHRLNDKWDLRRDSKRIAGFLFEEECLADLARLRVLWDGKVQKP